MGDIDRVTDAARAQTTLVASDMKVIPSDSFDLLCRVTNREEHGWTGRRRDRRS